MAWTRAAVAVGMPPAVAFFVVSAVAVSTTFFAAGLLLHLPGVRRVL